MGALPKALVKLGHKVTVYLPLYRTMRSHQMPLAAENIHVPFSYGPRFCAVRNAGLNDDVQHYAIEHDHFFDRTSIYGFRDDAERFYLLSRAAMEATRYLGKADLLHVHDWHTSLVPVLLRTQYVHDPHFARTPCMLTIHNMGYQGVCDESILPMLTLPWELFTPHGLEFHGGANLLKGGIVFADFVTAVSPRYAYEIQTREGGFELDLTVRTRSSTVRGILNGVDYSEWDPASDPHIKAHYTSNDLSGKSACKRDLLDAFGLPGADLQYPILGIVSRFAEQKGLDLIGHIAHRLAQDPVRIITLGSGDPDLEEMFRNLSWQYPGRFANRIAYDNSLAHKIEAGADMFLMPSRYEPCGLNQIYSLRYGTVPIVRAVGGLDDSIQQYNPADGSGTGFKFQNFDAGEFYDAISTSMHFYGHTDHWQRIQRNGMAMDYSWERSAREYIQIYEQLVRSRS